MKTQKVILLFLFVHCSIFLSAQIVNIEKKRGNQLDSVYWTGDVRLSFALIQNTRKIINANGSIRVDHVRYRHSFLSLTSYDLGRVDDQDFVNTGFQHFRYNYKINERLTWEAFTQLQYNEQIQLQFRGLLGTGPRVGLLLKEKQQLYFGALYMYEYEEEKSGTTGEEVVYTRDHRLSSYLNVHLQPLANLSLNSTTYYQPVLDQFEDFRLSTETSVEVKVTERLTFNTVFTLLYDAFPPDGIPSTIYTFRNGLKLSF